MTKDFRTLLNSLARRIAFAADKRQREALEEVRERCAELILGLDPDEVDRSSAAYRYGGFDALAAVVSSLEEQTIAASTRDLLHKSERARILNAILANPARNQRALAEDLSIQESNLAVYLRELLEEGLVEPSPSGPRGRTYAVTPWGRKAWGSIAAAPASFRVPIDELRAAVNAGEVPTKARFERLIGRDAFYDMLNAALKTETQEPLLLSTLVAKAFTGSTGSAQFHRDAIKLIQLKSLRRPLSWIVANAEESRDFQVQLLRSAREAGAEVCLYRIPPSSDPIPSRQVLDKEGLIYPASPGTAEVTEREVSREAWEQLRAASILAEPAEMARA